MSAKSSIEWTDASWTPIRARVRRDAGETARARGYESLVQIAKRMAGRVGPHCEHCSRGCDHCYSETNNERCLPSNGTGLPFDRRSRDLVEIFLDEKILKQPLHWRKPRRIFVCSQTDLFGEWVPFELVLSMWRVMQEAHWHTYQILTKRASRLREFTQWMAGADDISAACWPHQWLGVSVESREHAERIELLRKTPAGIRFLSIEPMLEDIGELNLAGISWVICGGESGPGARPIDPKWVRSIRDQCVAAGVPFFFKQWGGVNKKKAGRLLDGREWKQLPVIVWKLDELMRQGDDRVAR